MKTCVITGGTGLVGTHLVPSLSKGWKVYVASRRERHFKELAHGRHIPMDFSKKLEKRPLPDAVDAVIHLVQSEHFREFPEKAMSVFRVNSLSTMYMLDYAKKAGAKTFVMASSGGVYGYGDRGFSEDAPIESRGDLGFYLGTKLCSEVLSDCYSSFMNVIILRFFFVYGPGQRKNMLVPRLVQSVKDGRPIMLHGHDGIRINPTYVLDAVEAISESLDMTSSQKINVGGPEILSMRQIGEVIGQVVGKEPLFEMQKDVKPQSIIGDVKKMSRLLHRPRWFFQDGVESYVRSQEGING